MSVTTKSLVQCLEWARGRTDPEGDLADAVIGMRRYERAAALPYGTAQHETMLGETSPAEDLADWTQTWTSTWLATGADPAEVLGELHWVETLFARMQRLPYGSPQHMNALRYADAHRVALFDKLGLAPVSREGMN
jgi:hypothetical protein